MLSEVLVVGLVPSAMPRTVPVVQVLRHAWTSFRISVSVSKLASFPWTVSVKPTSQHRRLMRAAGLVIAMLGLVGLLKVFFRRFVGLRLPPVVSRYGHWTRHSASRDYEA